MIATTLLMMLAMPQDNAATLPKPLDPASWISPDDYPTRALRLNEQGLVSFTLDVSAKGKVTRCTVTTSSGSKILDSETCAIMRSRGRFEPAKDATGAAVASTYSSRFTWSIPN